MAGSNPQSKAPQPSWADDERSVERSVERAIRRSFVLARGTLLARKYRLTQPAGFGGMAQLWVATNEATGAEVCVKVLVIPESEDDDVSARFRREAFAAARLSHRAIVRIFDLVELGADGDELTSGGNPAALAIVMELLRGETLGDLIQRKGKLDLDETVDLALPIISALAHAHRVAIVHRDLKPDNIFLAIDPDDHVSPKVLDFGVSKMAPDITEDGVMVGTPSFMSPEQTRGARQIDARSDVFSLGILVYVMLAGHNPFDSENFHSVLQAILHVDPPVLPIARTHPHVWDVIERALAKDPAARFADAGELGAALRRATGRTSTNDSGPQSLPKLPVVPATPAPEPVVLHTPLARAAPVVAPEPSRARYAALAVIAVVVLLVVYAIVLR